MTPRNLDDLLECEVPPEIPILPTMSVTVFPLGVTAVQVGTRKNLNLLGAHPEPGAFIGLIPTREKEYEALTAQDFYSIGVAGRILDRLNLSPETVQVTVEGLRRIHLDAVLREEPYFWARVSCVVETVGAALGMDHLIGQVFAALEQLVRLDSRYSQELVNVLRMNLRDPGRFADLVATRLSLPRDAQRELLQTLGVDKRLEKLVGFLDDEVGRARVAQEVQAKVAEDLEQGRREYYLRQQLRVIQRELAEEDPQAAEATRLRERLEKAGLPPAAAEQALAEVERLRTIPPMSPEHAVIRTYLEWILAMPWGRGTPEELDLARVERVLDEDHYGLDKVKARVLEYLAVRKLRPDAAGPILCFAGPPGVGKTSLGQSIARALGRRFERLSVGGVRDEAAIRGHRRTYVGALPGAIVQSLRRAGSNNPVIMIDEIDKMGYDGVAGDPAAALLEVLDQAQNHAFVDHYLDVPLDLSQVFFITTANLLAQIPPPLLDRMEVIELSGYTEEEKVEIARRHVIPGRARAAGLDPSEVDLAEAALRRLIREYTREAGLRDLGRAVEALFRKCAREKVGGRPGPWRFPAAGWDLEDLLGPPPYTWERAEGVAGVGVATGLAWTAAGGDILFIEALRMKGSGQFVVTGHLGDVMRESVAAAYSFVRSRAAALAIDPEVFGQSDVHVHFPEGAVPKDGPSAGITIAVALASLFSGRPVRHDIAMTGEVTLRGRILAVGGIKEKVLAAHRAGIKIVLLPKANEKDLVEIPDDVRRDLGILPIDSVDQALAEAIIPVVEPERHPHRPSRPADPAAARRTLRRR